MKPLSVFLAFIFGLFILLVFPYLFIKLNLYLSLPVLTVSLLKILGAFFILIGFTFHLYCIRLFRLFGKGTPVPIEPPKKLVVRGIYKYTRNPMYVCLSLDLFGYFLLFGHISLLLYLLIAWLSFHLFIIFYEEPILKIKFGKDYIDYCKNTPRWL